MTAYMVAEMDVTDAGRLRGLQGGGRRRHQRYGGRYVSRGGRSASLEGDGPRRIVIVEFDSIEAAQRWYNSADYQAAKGLREKAAKGRLYVVEAT